MISFTVTKVLDGDTFEVDDIWKWKLMDGTVFKGTIIQAYGYFIPDNDFHVAWRKLEKLILGQSIEIRSPLEFFNGCLICDVYLNGKYLAEYFPEYHRKTA